MTAEKKNNWFEVDKEGLKQLQLGKPKLYAIRELIQNAWDEEVSIVSLDSQFENECGEFTITDNSKTGFNDISDAYTLFSPTAKRQNPEKRGRFNFGEKQAFSICEEAKVVTTKGTLVFNNEGRTFTESKIVIGTSVQIKIKMSKSEYDEILENVLLYIVPKTITFSINGKRIVNTNKPLLSFKANLLTEVEKEGVMRQLYRDTTVEIYPTDKAFLYEIGIPVIPIDCDYNIDVQQRIPLGIDRETIRPIFLKELYAEVLNNCFKILPEQSSGKAWVRTAIAQKDRMTKEATQSVLTMRYGDKVLVANPSDKLSIDDAIANGYYVIRGNEMGKDEWETIRSFGKDLIQTTSDLFSHDTSEAPEVYELTADQKAFATLTKELSLELLGHEVKVRFVRDSKMVTAVHDSATNCVTFNLAKMKIVRPFVTNITAVIFHEIAHEFGYHTEEAYHEALSIFCAKLYKKTQA